MENQPNPSKKENTSACQDGIAQPASLADGLDNWNQRLDKNLETETTANPEADENAKKFSDKNGSGDQSDSTE